MYWKLSERIFEEEQQGKERADYGSFLIRRLAEDLAPEFGSGFSYRQLNFCRQCYRTYPIVNALRSQLNWMQYRLLIQIEEASKREYYELEAMKNAWTGRELERQPDENSTIGILLCANKNNQMVKLALPENNKTILASQYKLYHSTEQQLLDEKRKNIE